MPSLRASLRRLPSLTVYLMAVATVLGAGGEAPAPLGAQRDAATGAVVFRVWAGAATRLELCLYDRAFGAAGKARLPMQRGPDGTWALSVPAERLKAARLHGPIWYGYRAWGPNWPHTADWRPGSVSGFREDVDRDGNRFNPNKLLLDPYAREVSHDPRNARLRDEAPYCSGANRAVDTGPLAPKGLVLGAGAEAGGFGVKPCRPFRDDVIYEVHLRGFTRADPAVPAELRGTYAGAATKAAYLASLGVTAVEFLPLADCQNEQNDLEESTAGDNYWGYDPLAYFAPERRYAADRTPGGPTRELRSMVEAFHRQGIKVYVDVVYNHTGEGGLWKPSPDSADVGRIHSFRGLDNAAYYETMADRRFYREDSGCGPNFNSAHPTVRRLILDSLRYWKDGLGVDGFRFDLAPILANRLDRDGFEFDASDPAGPLASAARELPVRPASGVGGVDLIAEPWGGTYALGRHPRGFGEWNDRFRDAFRRWQNQPATEKAPPREVSLRVKGSPDLFTIAAGRGPAASVNFVVAHDGFTLFDLVSVNAKVNDRVWPYGPSDGGRKAEEEMCGDQGGDESLQRQAARNAMAFLALSAGVPMMTGGDEMLRTQHANNNAYNVDSPANWLDWTRAGACASFVEFTRSALAFRRAHPALRPGGFATGTDDNGDGLADLTWLAPDASEATAAQLDDPGGRFLAWRLDGTESADPAASIYAAWNVGTQSVRLTLPPARPGNAWYLACDTAARREGDASFRLPGRELPLQGPSLELAARSLLVAVER
ncbi:MAG: glycogen-debranching protein [Candidatus Riflebacteria bacterium]|nr:glycogen-debranching protein [Candidatus Riflebacteria bacterium]